MSKVAGILAKNKCNVSEQTDHLYDQNSEVIQLLVKTARYPLCFAGRDRRNRC